MKVEVELEIPSGWRVKQVVDRYQTHERPGSGEKSTIRHTEGVGYFYFTAIIEPEPLAIQACRAVIKTMASLPSLEPCRANMVDLARQAIADFEKGGAK
jgi:hypothetical protein